MPNPPKTEIAHRTMVQVWTPKRSDGSWYIDGPVIDEPIDPFMTEFWIVGYVDAFGHHAPFAHSNPEVGDNTPTS